MDNPLSFDATQVNTFAKGSSWIGVEVTTDYPDEILANFEPEDILRHYNDVEAVVELWKEQNPDKWEAMNE